MKISAVRCILVSAPYASAGDSERERHLRTGLRPASFIKLETDEGLEGVGETYAGVYAPEAVKALVQQLEADLLGHEALNIAALSERLRVATYYWGRTGLTQAVIAGIEMALWDLAGKARDQPVHSLLGGRAHDALPVYASGGNKKPAAELQEEMRAYLAAGYRAVKIRINNLDGVDAIVETVDLCRRALGPGIGLAADAVQGLERNAWTVKKAVEIARLLEPYDMLWIEEPTEVTNYEGFAEIRRRSNIPIAGGETVTSLVEAEAYLRAGALDLFQPDASLIGGLLMFRRVAQMCERSFIPIAVHAWSSGVGIMGNYHAAFASPNCTILELPNVPNPLRDELLVEPIRIEGGQIAAPTAPGLGVDLPPDIEERYPYRPNSVYRILVE